MNEPVRRVRFRKCDVFLRSTPRELFGSDRAALAQVLFMGEYDELLAEVESGDCVLDSGANIGCFAIPAAIKAGGLGKVIAVEPDPENAKMLRRNIQANGLKNVIVEERALMGSLSSTVRFSPGGVTAKVDVAGSIDVQTTTLSDLLRRHSLRSFSVIKIDIEGSELSLLEDPESRDVLCKSRSVAVEVHSRDAEHRFSHVLQASGASVRGPRRELDYVGRLMPRILSHPFLTARLYGTEMISVAVRLMREVARRRTREEVGGYEARIVSAFR